MRYSDEQLKELQKVELGILAEIIRVCEKNGLMYFTVGGTTLGAIRHNGFIPWDDDIDIGMMRDDYERFIEIAPQELAEGYTLTHFKYDEEVPTYFAKVRKDGTKFVEEYTKDIDMHQGIFVDVFPFDIVPQNKMLRKLYNSRAKLWNQLFIAKSVNMPSFHPKKHKVLLTVIRKSLHVLMKPVSKEILYSEADRAMRAYNKRKGKKVSTRGLEVFCCDIKDLLPPEEHVFEDMKVLIPANADAVLKQQYGAYMQLPPEEERYNHAPTLLDF